jgi:predicted nucleic acid-binding protein
MNVLLDTNILLRWVHKGSSDHPIVRLAIDLLIEKNDLLFITPQNLIEYWSVATRPEDRNGLGLLPEEAARDLESLERFFPLLPDNHRVFDEWKAIVVEAAVRGRQAHDARLVAVMRAHDIERILTLDEGDFRRYRGVRVVRPSDVVASER